MLLPQEQSLRAHIKRILKSCNLILASSSPRRKQIIDSIPWINATVFPPLSTEELPCGIDINRVASYLARQKAESVFRVTGGVVLGADTIVILNDEILGKPADMREWESMLRKLSNNTHCIVTGYCIMSAKKIIEKSVKTYVTFGAFSEEMLYNYLCTRSGLDKAGGYGIQDALIKNVATVNGDYNNVVGLPSEVEKTLKEFF